MVLNGVQAQEYMLGEKPYGNRAAFPLPTLVLTDIKMPICDGFQLLEWIRKRAESSGLPVVVLSSSRHPDDVQRAYGLNANTYFVKPVDAGELNSWASNFADYWCHHATVSAAVAVTA